MPVLKPFYTLGHSHWHMFIHEDIQIHSYISLRVINSKKLLEHIVGYSAQHYHHRSNMMLSTALAPNHSIGSILFKEFLRGKPHKDHVTAIFSLHICQIDHNSLHQFLLILFSLTSNASRSLIIPWCSHGITTLGQITITPPPQKKPKQTSLQQLSTSTALLTKQRQLQEWCFWTHFSV